MDEKLVPAHIHFARWFIRLRWIAIAILILANLTVRHLFEVPIQEFPIYLITGILLILNIFHSLIIKGIKKKGGPGIVARIKKDIDFQIITDLILLTLILHYSGGIENPLVLFYFFHLIIASSIFSTLKSYLYTIFAIFLIAILVFFEYFSIIPHYNLTGFAGNELHNNAFYIFGTGFVFLLTAITIVSLSHLIIYRSIKSEEGYEKANAELENKDKLKNEYVLRVTHDIKGHVSAILSCLEVIRTGVAGEMNDIQKDFVNRAFSRTELLSDFVKNLLSLTRKRLRRDIEFEEVKIKELFSKITGPVKILAEEKGIKFQLSIDRTLGTMTGNPYSLEELFSNLLQNAVKYTPGNGLVSLVVKNHNTFIMAEVADSGIGIPKDEIPHIFDEFYRGTNVPRDMKTGSGLGLSIVKQIVENHLGKIWVSSEPGIWTRFTVILPVSQGSVS